MNGCFVELITPFDFNNNVDFNSLFKLLDLQIENKIDGLVLLGEASENYSLSKEEKLEIINKVINYIDKKMKIIVCVNEKNIEDVVRFCDSTKEYLIDGYLIGYPYLNKSDSSVLEFYNYLLDVVDKPIIVDINKEHNISVDVLNRLSYFEKIIGFRNCSLDLFYLIEISRLIKDNFKLFCGNDFLIIPSISLGAECIISLVGCAYPKQIKEIYDNFYENIIEVRKKFHKIETILKDVYNESFPSTLKYLLYLNGFNSSKTRMPLDECSLFLKRKIQEDCLFL